MSDRDEEITLKDKIDTPMTLQERAARKKLIITALERGIVHDFLHVPLPSHLKGQWARRDKFSVDRLKALGYWLDTEYATKQAINTDGTSAAMTMDVVFMVTTRENFDLIEEVRQEHMSKIHGKPNDPKALTKEESDFKEKIVNEGDIGASIESRTRTLDKDNLLAAISQ